MQYSGLILNDITAAPGLCVSFFVQGCPHRCPGCHNPETWDFDGGKEFTSGTLDSIINGLTAQGIQRNLCIMGGEPLCTENAFLTFLVIKEVKDKVPEAKIYVWTGYTLE
jgi:anaerobic ribonucleoside-triphosphate reductase activating protein